MAAVAYHGTGGLYRVQQEVHRFLAFCIDGLGSPLDTEGRRQPGRLLSQTELLMTAKRRRSIRSRPFSKPLGAAVPWFMALRSSRIVDRFPVLSGVRIRGPASLVLFQDRVAADREARCGVCLDPACGYVTPEHTGASVHAVGWTSCEGLTSGHPPGSAPEPQRRVYMKPLSAGGTVL